MACFSSENTEPYKWYSGKMKEILPENIDSGLNLNSQREELPGGNMRSCTLSHCSF